jgi:hypothetical protein
MKNFLYIKTTAREDEEKDKSRDQKLRVKVSGEKLVFLGRVVRGGSYRSELPKLP